MADRPVKKLGFKTPLEAASKPNLDKAAKLGVNGVMDVLGAGIPPGSDTAHLALLGYDPFKAYRGRGALEALGGGFKIEKSDVAFRGNFATVKEGVVLDRRAGRIDSETAAKLAESISSMLTSEKYPDVKVYLLHTTEHRLALILRGSGLSMNVSPSDPGKENKPLMKVKPLDESSEAEKTAEVLNEISQKIMEKLKNHPLNVEREEKGFYPANAVIFRGAGQLPEIPPLPERFNVKAAFIAVTALIRGVCLAAGMQPIEVKGATGTTKTDVIAKAKGLIEALKNNDFCLLHVKGADNASHDGNLEEKISMIERIDSMVGYILDDVNLEETYIAITSDHASPLSVRNHSGDPVPVVILGPEVIRDSVEVFSERSCCMGGLGRIKGSDLIHILMNYLGKIKKFGA
jgi:2,3-bisphosphoglycerate-independent phosphoglycerate mutase